jgi:hypothetical protein
MEGLLLGRGANVVTRQELDLIPTPPQTDTYIPISHYGLATRLLTISQDLLTDYALVGENYGIARQGSQLFAVLSFKNNETEMGLSVAFRNSLDKSMSVGLAIGAQVFCCSNLALHGDIVIMKKHTLRVWESLENLAISTLYKSRQNFEKVIVDAARLKGIPMSDREAFELMGYLYGNDIISPRQLTVVRDEWLKPSHEEFQPRNRWSLLNACTEALKTSPPTIIMEKHRDCYQAVVT